MYLQSGPPEGLRLGSRNKERFSIEKTGSAGSFRAGSVHSAIAQKKNRAFHIYSLIYAPSVTNKYPQSERRDVDVSEGTSHKTNGHSDTNVDTLTEIEKIYVSVVASHE